MDPRVYWLWLHHAFQPGSTKPKSIINRFKTVKDFYNAGSNVWSQMRFLNEKDVLLLSSYSIPQAAATLSYCESMGISVITPENKEYPVNLWNIPDPPTVLFVKGIMPDFNNCLSIAVVGSRKTSDLCLKTANRISYELSENGVVVVSGGAVGIDTEAHKGAMLSCTPTVAVLGCGLEFPYLMENELLRQKIVRKGGALITEYPPSMGVTKGTFQARNRIISGLCNGTLIVSAEKKSGTMITARRAAEQNRDIFAVPGNPELPISEGPNALIKNGATAVTKAQDILDFYKYAASEKPKDEITETLEITFDDILKKETKPELKTDQKDKIISEYSLEGNCEKLIRALSTEEKHISELVRITGLTSGEILSAITELEIFDLVVTFSGQRYALIKS